MRGDYMHRRVRQRLGLPVRPFPRRVLVEEFTTPGCYFEVSGPVESFRVEEFGDEREHTASLLASLGSEDLLFDIGGCVGMVAIHAARLGVEVVAFEPDPFYRSRLQKNLAMNRLADIVRVEPVAISDVDGKVTLHTDGADGWSPSLAASLEGRRTVEVAATTIDSYVRGTGIVPTAVKLDIEGAEGLALSGAQDLLAGERRPRIIFLELHPAYLPDFGMSSDEVMSLALRHGYEILQRDERGDQVHVTLVSGFA